MLIQKKYGKYFCVFLVISLIVTGVLSTIEVQAATHRNSFVYVYADQSTGYLGTYGTAPNGYKIYHVAPGAKIYASAAYDMINGSLSPNVSGRPDSNNIDEGIGKLAPESQNSGNYKRWTYTTLSGEANIQVLPASVEGFNYYMQFPNSGGVFRVDTSSNPNPDPLVNWWYSGGSYFVCGSGADPYIDIQGYEDDVTIKDGMNVVDVYNTSQMDVEAVVTPSDAWQGVSWSTSDNTIATIDQTGHITFKGKVGNVRITATSTTVLTNNKKKGELDLSVSYPLPILSVEQQFGNIILISGQQHSGISSYAMSDTPLPGDLNWQPSGLFSLHGAGTYYFYAKAVDGTISEPFEYIVPDVEAPIIQSVDVSDYSAVINATDDVGVFAYGCSLSNDADTVENWQMSDTFTKLVNGATYYAFAKDEAGHISDSFQFVVRGNNLDIEAPIVTAVDMTITETAKGAVISATDNVGVVGYGVSESTNLSTITWKTVNSFNNLKGGTTYYAFAKDAAGNISAPYEFMIGEPISGEDTLAPVVTAVQKIAGPKVRIIASDNVKVSGYGLSSTADPGSAIWKQSNTFSSVSEGNVYYAFAKDEANNISAPFTFIMGTDSEAPIVSDVQLNQTEATVIAEDNIGVAAYGLAESTDSSAAIWQASNKFTNLTEGVTYYAFAKDAEGNISNGFEFTVEAAGDTEAPIVTHVDFTAKGITITASDNVGVVKYGISQSPDPATVTWKSSNNFTSVVSGVTYYIFAQDAAGNISSPFQFIKP